MMKRFKIDPNTVEYDGHSFRRKVENQDSFMEWLKNKQKEMREKIIVDKYWICDKCAKKKKLIPPKWPVTALFGLCSWCKA